MNCDDGGGGGGLKSGRLASIRFDLVRAVRVPSKAVDRTQQRHREGVMGRNRPYWGKKTTVHMLLRLGRCSNFSSVQSETLASTRFDLERTPVSARSGNDSSLYTGTALTMQ